MQPDSKYNPAALEAEIPEELKETPPLETVGMLDKRFDDLITEIGFIHESRLKDFQNMDARKDRLPALQTINYFENYKQIRQKRIDTVSKVDLPVRPSNKGEKIKTEIDTYWNVGEAINGKNLLFILREFFLQKSFQSLEESALLLSRWQRFCKSSYDVVNHSSLFQQHFEKLGLEFTDSVHRFERIAENVEDGEKLVKQRQAAEDAIRFEAEKTGLVGQKKNEKKQNLSNVGALATEALKVRKANDKEAKELADAEQKRLLVNHRKCEDETEIPPDLIDPGFELSDLTIYMRELLSKYRGVREIETFRRRAKTMLLVDRVQLLRDYKLLSEITPGSHLLETLTEYDGVNLFMDSPPLKSPKVEDYITEFEILCAHYNIETSMLQEDGRPFTYEVDGRFTCKFLEQVLETNFQPYDQSVDEKVNTPILSSNEKAALDVKSAAVANAIFVLNSSGVTLPSAPRLKSSDWLNENTLNPQFEEYQDRQADILKQQKDVDFELMCEIELMRSNEMEVVLHRLKENARKTWELASKKPNSKPLLAKSGVLSKPGTRAIQEPERTTLQPRLPESFDLGMMVPDGRDHLSDHHVLDGKKQNFGQILRANEELNNADQDTSELNKRQNPASVDPTIATIFAEHEINSYFMLRFIRIREYRNILRTQLNFFRSIEKRINIDLRQSRLRSKLDVLEHFKPTYQNIASILKTYDFESDESTGTLGSDGKSPNVTFGPTKMQETCSEDLRSFKKGYIEIKDQQGVSIIYDTALTDLQTLETELLKQATVFINNGYRGRTTAGGSFFDDLLLKRDRSKADIKDITFINPLVDRAQLLLELLDCEVKYQNAKVEVVNAYMDVFEHTTSYADIKKLGQVLTNLIFSRPDIDFSATYFSRDYAFATKNLHIQAAMVTSLVSRTIENHRDWIERHISKIQVPEGLDDQTGGTGSPLSIGLPWLIKSTTSQKATMHSPGISLHLNEIIPALSTVISIQKEAQAYCNQFYSLLQIFLAKDGIVGIPNRAASKCVVWKGLNKLWREFCDQDFILPLKGRRLVGGLDNDDWLENPLLPDLILNEKYSPFDLQHASASSAYIPNMLSPYNMFTHPHFQPIGRDILVRSLKVLILRNRLYFSWIETDFWKFTYEEQFPQMGLEKNEYTGRLGAVNYDIPGMNDNTVVEDDDFEDLEGKEISYEAGDGHDGHGNVNTVHWRCGPLAIAELDDAHPLFDFSSLKSIMNIIRPLNISILTRTLKAQLVEKNWLMASAEINGFILHEIHKSAMCEKESDIKLDKNKRKKPARVNPKDKNNTKQFDVDYKHFIATNILTKKKQMRKAMMIEYTKESRLLGKKELKEIDKEEETIVLKYNLIDWYITNMKEVATEECERAEYTALMLEFQIYSQSVPAGKVLFRHSKILTNKDFVSGAAAAKDYLKLSDLERNVEIQEVATRAVEGSEKLTTLWYIPHITECLLTMGVTDKIARAAPDMMTKFYQNGNLYRKSIKLQTLVIEVMRCISIFASLYCDNSRFVKSVRDLREAEYIANAMSSIKKDLAHQGSQADFETTETYLLSKWELWFMKTRLALLSVGYTTAMKILPQSSAMLNLQEEIMSQKKKTDKLYNPMVKWDFSKLKMCSTYPKFIRLASRYSFSALEPAAKECAETKIGELEDTMEQYTQATMLNFGENNDELNKSQMDYLLTRIRLFLLRREYINLTLFGAKITKEEHVKEIMRLYKMRVIVGAIRMYHKQGARGNAATAILLQDEIVKSTKEMELNRMSMAAFEKCQITVLLGELSRQYTTNLLRNAKQYFNQLCDERTGKLFKGYEYVEVQPASGERQFAFKVNDKNYSTKQLILQSFVDDLYRSNGIYLKEKKKESVIPAAQVLAGKASAVKAEENDRIFSCTKDQLAKAIQRMALQFTKWGENHIVEQEHMLPGVINKMNESLKNSDKIIANLLQERRDMQEIFNTNVRLATATAIADIHAELASKSVELNDLRKSRRIDEKKIRSKIIDEYDDLVSELAMENHVIRNRFNEYRTNTVQEMVGIIAETKKEELVQLTESSEMPDALKSSALRTIEHDDAIKALEDELHEVNMTLLKVRTMYTIKEQSLRSSFTKQIKSLTEENKLAEEKLWDSYRNAEAREQTLRKLLSKSNKDALMAETRNEMLQKQLKEEQAKVKQMMTKNDRSTSARIRTENSSSQEARIMDAMERLKYYEKINVDKLLAELKEKTEIIEDFLQKGRNETKTVLQMQVTKLINHNKLDILRPATAAVTGEQKKRPINEVLQRLAVTTEQNNELKRKLSILTVTQAGKKAVAAIPPLPQPKTEKPKIITAEKGVQTFIQTSNDELVVHEIEPMINPYNESYLFDRHFYDDLEASNDEDYSLESSKRTSLSVKHRSKAGSATERYKRQSVSPTNRPSTSKQSTRMSGFSERVSRTDPSGRINIPSRPPIFDPTNVGYILDNENLKKSKRSSLVAPKMQTPSHIGSSFKPDDNITVGGQSIGHQQKNSGITLPILTQEQSDSKKSVWDEIFDYAKK